MENGVFSVLELHAHGFHESLAHRLAIAGIHVNMFAPQTLRTVIGVAAPAYKKNTPFAGEVFFGTLEFSRSHHCFLPPFSNKVRAGGFEPPTPCVSSKYSNQLSYARITRININLN